MSTWFGELFPWQIASVMLGAGTLMLAFDAQRMQRARLVAEARFAYVAGWFYIVAAIAALIVGGFL